MKFNLNDHIPSIAYMPTTVFGGPLDLDALGYCLLVNPTLSLHVLATFTE